MTKKLFAITLFALITVTSAFAITPSKMSVDIPFDFNAAGEMMPAGRYTVDMAKANASGVMTITDRNGRSTMLTSTPASQVRKGAGNRIVFHQHNDEYFLVEVAAIEGTAARKLPRSKYEKELVSSTSRTYRVIAIRSSR